MCFSIVDFLEYFLQFIFTSHRHVRAFLIFLAIALPNPSTTSVLLCCCTPPLVFRVCSAFTSECCSVPGPPPLAVVSYTLLCDNSDCFLLEASYVFVCKPPLLLLLLLIFPCPTVLLPPDKCVVAGESLHSLVTEMFKLKTRASVTDRVLSTKSFAWNSNQAFSQVHHKIMNFRDLFFQSQQQLSMMSRCCPVRLLLLRHFF